MRDNFNCLFAALALVSLAAGVVAALLIAVRVDL